MTDTNRRQILVADDEPHIGRIIKLKLEQGPFDVTAVYDGLGAVEAMRENSGFSLVLLDLMMPHMSGLDVLEHMRDTTKNPPPMVILTAAGQNEQRQRAMDLGATAFLTKPFSPRKLYALVCELTGLGGDDDYLPVSESDASIERSE